MRKMASPLDADAIRKGARAGPSRAPSACAQALLCDMSLDLALWLEYESVVGSCWLCIRPWFLRITRARKRMAKMSGHAGDPVACREHRMRRKNPLLHGMSQFLWGCDCCALKFSTGYDGLVPRKLHVLSCGSGVSGCMTVRACVCVCVRACVQTCRHSIQQCASATDRSSSTVAPGDSKVNPATEKGPREARDSGGSASAEGGGMVAEGAEEQQEGQEEEEGGRSSNLRTAEGAEEQQ